MGLADRLRGWKRRLVETTAQEAELVVQVAAERYAPKGPNYPSTQSLAKNIVALPVQVKGSKISVTIVSTARARNGYDYAPRQHNDENLRHTVNPPGGTSFADFAQGRSRENRYAKGLKNAGNPPRFATKYLIRALGATAHERMLIRRSAKR